MGKIKLPSPAQIKELQESQERYEKFFQAALFGVVIHDGKRIIFGNQEAVRLVGGKSQKEFIGKSILPFIHPESRVAVAKRILKMMVTGKTAPLFREKFVRVNGEPFNVEVTSTPIHYQGKSAFQTIFRDINTQVKEEEELRQERQHLSGILNTQNTLVVRVDLKNKITYMNAAYKRAYGLKVGDTFWVKVHPDDAKATEEALAKLQNPPFKCALEQRSEVRGKWRWVWWEDSVIRDSQGKIIEIQGVGFDIDARKKAEEELMKAKIRAEETAAQEEALLESIGEGVVSIDVEGRIIFINKVAQRVIGKSAWEIAGQPFERLLPLVDEKGQHIPKERMPLQVALEKGETVAVSSISTPYYLKPDSEPMPIALTATPVKLGKDTIGAIVVFRDVRMEKKVDRAKTEFVFLASHQLLTPLSAIKWYLELILAGDTGEVKGRLKDYLETAYKSTSRMGNLVNALLNVSRLEMGTFAVNPENTEISALADTILEDFAANISGKRLTVKKDYRPPRRLKVDPNLMHIILQNLISNAVKYTPENGEITVSLSKKGEDFLIQVSDTGLGISQEDQPEVFTKLFRGKNIQEADPEGVGLGLYIVKSMVERLGGKIWFTSTEGKGTTFFVTIPLTGMVKREGSRTLIARKENAKK